jgi:hypothetical protein
MIIWVFEGMLFMLQYIFILYLLYSICSTNYILWAIVVIVICLLVGWKEMDGKWLLLNYEKGNFSHFERQIKRLVHCLSGNKNIIHVTDLNNNFYSSGITLNRDKLWI